RLARAVIGGLSGQGSTKDTSDGAGLIILRAKLTLIGALDLNLIGGLHWLLTSGGRRPSVAEVVGFRLMPTRHASPPKRDLSCRHPFETPAFVALRQTPQDEE